MEFVLIGIVSALNLLFIKKKLEKKRYEDAIIDLSLMIILAYLFQGSYGGMVVAMVASLFISISFYLSPPKFFSGNSLAKAKETFKNINNFDDFDYEKQKQKRANKRSNQSNRFKL